MCVCVCMCVGERVCVYVVCVRISVCVRVRVFACTRVCLDVCGRMCVFVWMSVDVRLVFVCLCVRGYGCACFC